MKVTTSGLAHNSYLSKNSIQTPASTINRKESMAKVGNLLAKANGVGKAKNAFKK
jgi:hypothetical protein